MSDLMKFLQKNKIPFVNGVKKSRFPVFVGKRLLFWFSVQPLFQKGLRGVGRRPAGVAFIPKSGG